MIRVLRPGGRLLLDHVAGATRPVRAVLRLIEVANVPVDGQHFRRPPIPHTCRSPAADPGLLTQDQEITPWAVVVLADPPAGTWHRSWCEMWRPELSGWLVEIRLGTKSQVDATVNVID
jgi:hypothetical protein